MRNKLVVVIPNINGLPHLKDCLDSLREQTLPVTTVLVDNASSDGSVAYVTKHFPDVAIIQRDKNYGFTGGVNPGIEWAITNNYPFVALLNNDAIADRQWAKELVKHMETHSHTGIATSKITDIRGKHLDSTGEFYTSWGLPFSRGRGEPDTNQYDSATTISAASGGASIYRVSMLKKIGLFDQDFFAYYEDVDISLRAILNGWQIKYVPTATVRHHIGATSRKMHGFAAYQTIKNLPMLAFKNVPTPLLWPLLPRLLLAHGAFFWKAVLSGKGTAAIKGWLVGLGLIVKKIPARRRLMTKRKTSIQEFNKLLVHDLPPNATNLRKLRQLFIKRGN